MGWAYVGNSMGWVEDIGPMYKSAHIKQSPCNGNTHTRTHTRFTALFPGLPGWAGTRKAKPIWILLKQETVSGSGISWAICKSAPSSRQITMPAPHHSVFYRSDALPAAQPTMSKHWRPHRNSVGNPNTLDAVSKGMQTSLKQNPPVLNQRNLFTCLYTQKYTYSQTFLKGYCLSG